MEVVRRAVASAARRAARHQLAERTEDSSVVSAVDRADMLAARLEADQQAAALLVAHMVARHRQEERTEDNSAA